MLSQDTHLVAKVRTVGVTFDSSFLYPFLFQTLSESYFLHLQRISWNLSSPIHVYCYHPDTSHTHLSFYHSSLPVAFSVSTIIIYPTFSPKQLKRYFKNITPFPYLKASNFQNLKFLSMDAHFYMIWLLSPLMSQLVTLSTHFFCSSHTDIHSVPWEQIIPTLEYCPSCFLCLKGFHPRSCKTPS